MMRGGGGSDAAATIGLGDDAMDVPIPSGTDGADTTGTVIGCICGADGDGTAVAPAGYTAGGGGGTAARLALGGGGGYMGTNAISIGASPSRAANSAERAMETPSSVPAVLY